MSDEDWRRMLWEYLQQKRAHYAVAKNLERGILVRLVCCFCRSNDSEAHHPDYRFPLGVLWTCRSCHRKEHVAISKMTVFQRSVHAHYRMEDAFRLGGESAHWSFEEALAGCGEPEEDWGSPEDFLETIVEYDQGEVARAAADSEDCLPVFVHETEMVG